MYAKKSDDLDKRDTFKETPKVSKVTQKGIRNLNTPITNKEIESMTKLPTKESPGLNALIGKFYQAFKEDLSPISSSSSQPPPLPSIFKPVIVTARSQI